MMRIKQFYDKVFVPINEIIYSLQAARKHDIPYPTFVLYANRVHNMLGPSPLNGYGLGGKSYSYHSRLIRIVHI